ncbi:MAG: dTMP kinase [Candidatus Blackburnbacteria bacterium]|nr:dTMP kinase [Candidatus Blackburnbacteria bacterium]
MAKKGKLIVFEGIDGSGKATQGKLLLASLRKKGRKAEYIEFPRYHDSFHGKVVGRYLTGEFGRPEEINPYLVSLAYALDRLTAKDKLKRFLAQGKTVISNRYIPSNMVYQGARLGRSQRRAFLEWLSEMEYKVHGLPKEDLVIFLHLSPEIGQKLVDKRGERDLYETNLAYLKEVEKMYLALGRGKNWARIECLSKMGNLRTKDEIHRDIARVVGKEVN